MIVLFFSLFLEKKNLYHKLSGIPLSQYVSTYYERQTKATQKKSHCNDPIMSPIHTTF